MDLRSKVLFVLIIYSAFVCGGFFATLVNKVGNAQEVKIEAQVQEYNVFFPKEYPNAFCVNKNPTK